MKPKNLRQHGPGAARRIAGHAQEDHILDPYQLQQKLSDPTVCPQCGAVYHNGRWQWANRPEEGREALCSACRRINDKFPLASCNSTATLHRSRPRKSFAWRVTRRKPKRASIRSTASSVSRRMHKGLSSTRQTFICRAGSAKPPSAPCMALSTSISMLDTKKLKLDRHQTTGNSGPGRSGPDIE